MTKKILLATFIDGNKIEEFFTKLDKFYSIKKSDTFIFSLNGEENYMITFKLNFTENLKNKIKGTNLIQIHKKGGCFYTINGLNKLIERDFDLKEGNVNHKSFQVNWDSYQDKVLLSKGNYLIIQDIKKVIL